MGSERSLLIEHAGDAESGSNGNVLSQQEIKVIQFEAFMGVKLRKV